MPSFWSSCTPWSLLHTLSFNMSHMWNIGCTVSDVCVCVCVWEREREREGGRERENVFPRHVQIMSLNKISLTETRSKAQDIIAPVKLSKMSGMAVHSRVYTYKHILIWDRMQSGWNVRTVQRNILPKFWEPSAHCMVSHPSTLQPSVSEQHNKKKYSRFWQEH